MNWKLTQKIIDNEGTARVEIDEWDIAPRPPTRHSQLDAIYDDLVARGEADGIVKLGPGRYRVPKGWLSS